MEELNGKLLEQCVKYLEHKVESRPQKVATMLEEDQQALYPLPKYPLDVSKKAYPTVGRYSTVLFETNQYSVPCKYRGKSTLLKAYPNTIEVWVNGELVAVHNRCQGKKQESLDLQHYLPILAQKGRAIRYARPVRNAVPLEFIDWMDSQHLKPKEMVELLEQCLSDGYQAVIQRKTSEPSELDFSNEVNVQFVDLGQYQWHFCTSDLLLHSAAVNSCYEMTFFKRKRQRNLARQIVRDAEWHLRETKTIQIPALATLLYVDWIPQDNGSPPALLSIVVDRRKGAIIAIA